MGRRIGFVVNPIAGMGGRVALKGTDGVVDLARERGALPSAEARAIAMLRVFRAQSPPLPSLQWLTCSGSMGADALSKAGIDDFEVVHEPADPPCASDTRRASEAFLEHSAEIVVFCGGDGTARDVCAAVRRRVPMLGVPAGVKMYSGVFGVSVAHAAKTLYGWLEGRLGAADADVLDVDEERFRAGELRIRLHDAALTPHAPHLVQCAKAVIEDESEDSAKARIAEHLAEELQSRPDRLFLLGPGSTVASIARRLELQKSLLGVDAVRRGALVGRDLAENGILELLESQSDVALVVSPIGAQGFVLGRGNQQLSPEVIRRVGRDHLVVVATPTKLDRTPALRFDTGDAALDAELAEGGFLRVVTGYHQRRLVPVEI